MKRKYLLMIALVVVIVFGAGCSKEESSVMEDSNELKITTSIVKSLTKSIVSSFSDDIIGIYVDDAADVYNPSTSSKATVSVGSNSATPSPAIYINADAKVYAWYPATADELTSPTSTSTKNIEVLNADDFSATSQTDYLWATPTNVTKDNRTAALTFQHALSKIIFKVNKDENFPGTGDLTEISLMAPDGNFFKGTDGEMTIADGSISGLKHTYNLTYTGTKTLSTTATDFVAIVSPTTLASNINDPSTIVLRLTIDNNTYSALLPVSPANIWAAGNVYTYNITVNNEELKIGTVLITDWVTSTTTIDATIKVAVVPEVTETANCYMIVPGNRLKIPVNVRGNGVNGEVVSTGISSTISNPLSVGILWQTSPGLITLSDMSSDEKVTITANSEVGNAVIAVYDGANQTGNILWSWHIWVTDYDPNLDTPLNGTTYPLDNSASESYVFMDRNLGATTVTPNTVFTLGLLYQWGRKDPFPGSASTSANTEPIIYNASGNGSTSMIIKKAVFVTSNLDNTILNPLTFYLGRSTNSYDWYSGTASTHNDSLWGGADISAPGDKTMFDPSPAGWRVPAWKSSASPWTAFMTSTFAWDDSDYGRTYTDGSFYPAVGHRYSNSGFLDHVGIYAYYWSGSPKGSYEYALNFYNSYVNPSAYSGLRAQGFSVRCVKDR